MSKQYVLDAKNKTLGRLASETAVLLRGKKEPDFAPHKLPQVRVKIINAANLKIDEKKINQKTYRRHSQYPGGEKIETLKRLMERRGISFVIKKAVMGMLAKNKLQKKIIKNLTIEE